LSLKVAFVITTEKKREEGSLVPIVVFFTFVAVVVLCTVALAYSISSFEEQSSTRRCRMPHEMYRRKVRKQRVRCRLKN
jgi:hypothetical protein